MRLILSLLAALIAPAAALANPHIFVRAQVTVAFDDTGDVAVRLDWSYDDLFSLLVTSDLGLDMDGDLVLTKEEQELLDARITAWPEEYTGDLEVSHGGTLLALGDKRDHTMTYKDGLFHEAHVRPVTGVDPGAPLEIRVFDPSFYTAYDLERPVIVTGRDDCTVAVVAADLDAAYALAESLTGGVDPAAVGPDDYFPAIGDAFADTIVVTCAGQ